MIFIMKCIYFQLSNHFHLIIGVNYISELLLVGVLPLSIDQIANILQRLHCSHFCSHISCIFFARHLNSFILTLECGEWSIILVGFWVCIVPYRIAKFFSTLSLSFFTRSVVLMEVAIFFPVMIQLFDNIIVSEYLTLFSVCIIHNLHSRGFNNSLRYEHCFCRSVNAKISIDIHTKIAKN